MKTILKIALTIVYPFWFFVSKTMVGIVLLGIFCFMWFPLLMQVLLNDDSHGEEAKSIASGMMIFSLFLFPFTAMFFIKISEFLKSKYRTYGYVTELNHKWVMQ